MALAMVVSRLAVTGLRAARLPKHQVLTQGPIALYR
jgi:hypothetical protein